MAKKQGFNAAQGLFAPPAPPFFSPPPAQEVQDAQEAQEARKAGCAHDIQEVQEAQEVGRAVVAHEAQEVQEAHEVQHAGRAHDVQEVQDAVQMESLPAIDGYGHTQGRKGQRMPRINMAFSPQNRAWVIKMSRQQGMTMTEYINMLIDQERSRRKY